MKNALGEGIWTLVDVSKTNKINSLMRQHPLQSLSTFLALVGERLKKAGARMGRAARNYFRSARARLRIRRTPVLRKIAKGLRLGAKAPASSPTR
jgi:hypothetical protein